MIIQVDTGLVMVAQRGGVRTPLPQTLLTRTPDPLLGHHPGGLSVDVSSHLLVMLNWHQSC